MDKLPGYRTTEERSSETRMSGSRLVLKVLGSPWDLEDLVTLVSGAKLIMSLLSRGKHKWREKQTDEVKGEGGLTSSTDCRR